MDLAPREDRSRFLLSVPGDRTVADRGRSVTSVVSSAIVFRFVIVFAVQIVFVGTGVVLVGRPR